MHAHALVAGDTLCPVYIEARYHFATPHAM